MKNHTISRVLLLALLSLTWMGAQGQCLSSWKYAAPVEVSNSTEFVLSSFQVKITLNTASLVTAGKMKSNGDDIRFTENGSCDLLPYWIESGMNSSNTVIWVRTTKIPASGKQTLTIYYGNSSASAASDGDATFDLFDDFNTSSLNMTKWSKYGPGTSTFVQTGGKLRVTSSSASADAIIRSANTVPAQITFEANVSSISTGGTGIPSIAILSNTGFFGYTLNNKGTTMVLGAANSGCASYNSSAIETNTTPGSLTGIWGIQWPTSDTQVVFWPGGSIHTADTGKDISSTVNVAFGNLCQGSRQTFYEWVRVRRYAPAEPKAIPDLTKEKKNDIGSASIEVDPGPYCQGSEIEVPYTIFGNIPSNNVFVCQLSDSSGSFENPTQIGTYSSSSAGTIFATLPTNIYGDHFAIRVIGTDTLMTSVPSPADIVISAPPAAYTGPDQSICAGEKAVLGGKAVSGNFYRWTSSNDTSFSSSDASITVSPAITTVYTLEETTGNGCRNANVVTVTVLNKPQIYAETDRITIAGQHVSFGMMSGMLCTSCTYAWTSDPAGYTSSNAAIDVNPQVTTSYFFKATNTSGCSAYDTVVVHVVDLTTDAGRDISICKGDSATLSTEADTASTYVWYTDADGVVGTNPKMNVSPASATTYTVVRGKVYTINGYSETVYTADSVTVTVNERPEANVGSAATICQGEAATIGTAAVSGSTYKWTNSNDSTTWTTSSITVSPTATTTYTLTETNANRCSKTNTVTVKVYSLPTADAGSDKLIMNTTSATIGGSADANNTYSWVSIPSGFTSTDANPSVSPSSTTTYVVTVKNANGCTSTDTVIVKVAPKPTADPGDDATICAGENVGIGADSVAGSTYSWVSNPSGFSSSDADPVVSPSVTTTYTVTEKDVNGFTNSNSVTITVNSLPSANTDSAKSICTGQSTTLGGTAVSGNTYAWTNSENNTTWTTSSITVNPTETTTYTLTETNANGCSKTNTVTVTVNSLPVANAGSDATINKGTSTTIGTTAVSGNSYSWTSVPTGFTSTSATPSVSPTATTSYVVSVTNASGCVSTDTVTITVKTDCDNDGDGKADKDYGTKNCNTDGTLCAWFSPDGKKVIVTSTGKDLSNIVVKYDGCSNHKYDGLNGKSYTITSSSCQIIGVWIKAGNNKSGDGPGYGEYVMNLYGKDNVNRCKDGSSTTTSTKPTITANGSTTFCDGGDVTLTSSEGDYYTWSTVDGSIGCNTHTRSITVSQSGTYYVTVKKGTSETKSDGITITVNERPVAKAGSDVVYYYGYSNCPTLTGGSNVSGVTYTWSTGATTQSIQVCPTSTTTYWLTVTKNGCTSVKDYITVTVIDVRCSGSKVEMCKKSKSYCVSKSNVESYLSCGYTLGSCGTHHSGCGAAEETDASEITPEVDMNVYPNPFNVNATVEVSLATEQNVSIDIISMDGKVVKSVFTGMLSADATHVFSINGASMQSGIYLVRVSGEGLLEFRRITIVK